MIPGFTRLIQYTPWRRRGGFDPYKNAREAQKETIAKRYDLLASNIPSPTDREPLPSEKSAREAREKSGVESNVRSTTVAEPQSSEQVPVHVPLSVGQKRPRSPTLTDDTPQKKIKEDVFSDNLKNRVVSVVQTSGSGRRTSTQPNESCDELPRDPDANLGNRRCIRTTELRPWADCSASTRLFPFKDLPLPQFSAVDGSSEINVPSAEHPSTVLPPERTTTSFSSPLDCVHVCKSLPDAPPMLIGSRPRYGELNDDSVYGDGDHLNIGRGDRNNTCQVPRDLPDLCIGGDSGDINSPTTLPNGDSRDTRPLCPDTPDLCIGNDDVDVDLPVVLLNGNNVHGQGDNQLNIANGSDGDDVDSPALLPVFQAHSAGLRDGSVYGQDGSHLDIENGDSNDASQVPRDSPDLCIGDDGDDISSPAALPASQVHGAANNDVHGRDGDYFDIENGDSHDTSPVRRDSPVLCPGSGDDDTDLLAMLPSSDNVYGQDNDHLGIANSDSHDTSQVHRESPDLRIRNDSDDIDLPVMLSAFQSHGAGLNDDNVYGQGDDLFDFENQDGNDTCQVPHDHDISMPAVAPVSQICSAEVNDDSNDTSQVHCDLRDPCTGVGGDGMDIESGNEGNVEGRDDVNGNNRIGGRVDNDINGSDDDRESIHILDTDDEYMDEDYQADYDGEGEVCHDGENVLRTYPETPQGRQASKQPKNCGRTARGGKQENCHGGASSSQARSGMDKDIALGQLLNGDQNQSATKGDVVILASAILDLQDAITRRGTRDSIPTGSEPLPATQPTPTFPEPMGGSDNPMPDYRRKPRNKPKLGLQENVRRHAVYLLKRKNRKQPFPKIASPNETALYTATGQGGPTADNFCLDFHGPLASAWNKRAAEVFASHFFDCGWYGSPKKDDIKRVFETHLRTLRAQYAKLNADNPSDDEQSQIKRDEEKEKARAQRRRSLRHRRANACSAHLDLARFSSLLATLPPDAMSGDETDHQPCQKRYAITKLTWRSQAATEWLRIFDLVHLSTRFNCNGRAKRGAFPHTRIPSRRVEMSSQPVPRLPSNFYDAAWLLTLDDDAKTQLKMLPEVDLTHTTAVLAVAEKYKHVKGRKFQCSQA